MPPKPSIRNLDMPQPIVNIDFSEPQVMAIINITPDSFYARSRTFTSEEIEARVAQVVSEGATIIDIGGYSSRPSADDISVEQEWRRVERGIAAVRKVAPKVAISIDTFRSEVARRSLERFGALIINDISSGGIDSELIAVAAKYNAPYIAMHMRGTPQTMQLQTEYDDVVEDVTHYFVDKIEQLKAAGIEKIIIDPGFGFAKTVEQNYELLSSLSRLTALGYPVLAGLSRKSMIYKPLGVGADEALTGTIALNWEALRQGATILRVHDVQQAHETIKLYRKFLGL